MSAVKERIMDAVSIMSDTDAEIIWNIIINRFSVASWDSVEEAEPDEIDLQMLAELETNPDCHDFISTPELLEYLNKKH